MNSSNKQVVYHAQGLSVFCEEVSEDELIFQIPGPGRSLLLFSRLTRLHWTEDAPESVRHKDVFSCALRPHVDLPRASDFCHHFLWNYLVDRHRTISPVVGESLRVDGFWHDQAHWSLSQQKEMFAFVLSYKTCTNLSIVTGERELNQNFGVKRLLFT